MAVKLMLAGFLQASAKASYNRNMACVQRGDFKVKDPALTLELLLGMMLAAMHAMSTLPVGNDMPEEAVRHVLMAFGVAEERIATLIGLPLPDISLPQDSLLVSTADQN